MIKLAIFDLDDTLISEYDYVKSGYYAVASFLEAKISINRETIFQALLQLFQQDKKEVFNRFFAQYHIAYQQKDISELVDCYRAHIPNIKLFEDVMPFLSFLEEKNVKTCIISDGYLHAQRNKILATGLDKHIDRIYLTDEFGADYWKPDDRCFVMARDFFQVGFDEMLYIGDNPQKDFYVTKSLRIRCARIYRKNGVYAHENYLEGVKPQYYIHSLEQLKKEFSSDAYHAYMR